MLRSATILSGALLALLHSRSADATSLFGSPDVIVCDVKKAGVLTSRRLAFVVGSQIYIPGDTSSSQVVYGVTDPLGTGPKDRWVLTVAGGIISTIEVPSGYTTSTCQPGVSVTSLQTAGRTHNLSEIAIGGPGASVPGSIPSPIPKPSLGYNAIGQNSFPASGSVQILVGLISQDGSHFKVCSGDATLKPTCANSAAISALGDGVIWRAVTQTVVSNQLRIVVGMISTTGDQFKICMGDIGSAPICGPALAL